MARPLSWLKDLHSIRKRLAETVRSHYTRGEIEELFGLGQTQASALMRGLPVTKVGTSLLVKREDLVEFLNGVNATEDETAFIEEYKEQKAGVSRRKLRELVRRDYDPMSVYGIPETLKLSRGEMTIRFGSVDELADTLLKVSQILTDDLEEFAKLYEPIRECVEEDDTNEELRRLFAELREMEQYASSRGTEATIQPDRR